MSFENATISLSTAFVRSVLNILLKVFEVLTKLLSVTGSVLYDIFLFVVELKN